MRPIMLVCPLASSIPHIACDYMGVDAGARLLAKNKIHMEYAIGDFDSMAYEDQEIVKKYAIRMKVLNCIKDDSDLEAAIRLAKEAGYKTIYITGALGGRCDHHYVNERLLVREREVKLILIDEYNCIQTCSRGEYIFKKNMYKYFSVFALEPSVISLSGFKYSLDHRMITPDDVYTLSNEIADESAVMEVHQGRVIVFEANDKKSRSS